MATKNNESAATRKDKRLPRHIVAIRLSAMGDVVMLAHTLRAFKAAYPDVKVTVATRKQFESFFDGIDVDFIFVDTKGRHRGLRGLWHLYRDIGRRGVDAIADMHGVLRSIVVRTLFRLSMYRCAKINKGKVEKWFRVGYNSQNSVPLKHTVVRYCDVLRDLGFEFDNPAPAVKIPRPNPMGEKHGIWVGFAPFSAHDGKTYPADLRVEAVRLLSERYDRVFVHSGGGAEAEFAMQMERTYPNVTAVNGKVDLAGELNLISNLDCIVSMDSLAMHMASLVATPVVSVWGATHPALGFLGYGCSSEGILQVDMPCRPCSVYGEMKCQYGDYRCLRAITPEMIVDKVDEMIAASHADAKAPSSEADASSKDSTATSSTSSTSSTSPTSSDAASTVDTAQAGGVQEG